MSDTQNWKIVGKVKEAHGLSGDLYILVFSGETSWSKNLPTFKLDQTIYKTEKIKAFKKGLILKTAQIKDRTQADQVKGQSFAIPAEHFISKKDEVIYLSEIEGFEVISEQKVVGPIQSFLFNGAHDILLVKTERGQVQIPFVADYIDDIDFERHQVFMRLPAGLLEIQWGDI